MENAAQPLTFGQILDHTFRVSRANLKSFIAISIVPGVGYVVAVLMMVGTLMYFLRPDRGTPQPMSPPEIAFTVAVFLVGMIVLAAVFAIFQPAACFAALQADLGIPTRFREAYTTAWSKLGRYVWLIVLKGLIVAGPTYVALILLAALSLFRVRTGGSDATSLLVVIFPLLILVYFGGMIYAIFMMIRLALATPASVAEDLPAYAAIKRSMQLTRNAKGRVFLVALVIYAANNAAMMILEMVFIAIAGVGALLFAATHVSLIIQIVLASIFGVLFLGGALLLMGALWTSFSVAFTLVYRDQRLRHDSKPAPGAVA
jgi:hypothetical protein